MATTKSTYQVPTLLASGRWAQCDKLKEGRMHDFYNNGIEGCLEDGIEDF